jgi:RNA polymerase sigma-70 factor (ECF subfamily)
MKTTPEPRQEPAAEAAVSLEKLFADLESPLLKFAHRIVQNNHTAQDVVQEAFLRLQRRLGEVDRPRPWLYSTVHNLALDHLRDNHKVIPMPDNDASAQILSDETRPPSWDLERRERIGQVRVCVERLETKHREILELKFSRELSYKEIAKQTDLTVGNVGYRLHHALKALEAELAREGVSL